MEEKWLIGPFNQGLELDVSFKNVLPRLLWWLYSHYSQEEEPRLLKGWAWLCLQWHHLHPGRRRRGLPLGGCEEPTSEFMSNLDKHPANGWVGSQWGGPPWGCSGRPRAPKSKPIMLVIGALPPAHHLEYSCYSLISCLITLAFFVVMLPQAHLTSHSRMSGFRWLTTPLWLSWTLRAFLYRYVYTCHFFLISSVSATFLPFLSFIVPIFEWSVPLVSPVFLKRSLVFPVILFPSFFVLFT